ncbi:CHAT domain-containing protein [Streptomyces sp. NPDC047070]|uniref:CHAT domain-containing protein n=1 Tax=Streptomyces sp. NPDC047070 TaxID=3154923 RepID=UPI0034542332
MTVSGTQGSTGEGTGGAEGGLFGRAVALSQEWAAVARGPGTESGATGIPPRPDPVATDRMLRELAEAEPAVGERDREALRMARGSLLGLRYLAGGAAEPAEERAEAISLLQEARAAVPVTEREIRSHEAVLRLLVRLLMPNLPTLGGPGQVRQDYTEMMKVGAAYFTPGGHMRDDLAEVGTLLEELAETADPSTRPELERWTEHMRQLSGTTGDRASMLELAAQVESFGTMPPHLAPLMGAVMELLKTVPEDHATTTPASTPTSSSSSEPATAPAAPDLVAQDSDELLPVMELMAPGLLDRDEFEQAASDLPRDTWQEQITAGLISMSIGLRDGDAERLVEAGEPLLEAFRDEDVPSGVSPVLLAGLLSGSALIGGNREDTAGMYQLLSENFGRGDVVRNVPPGPMGKELADAGRVLLLHQRVSEADDDDLDTFDDIAELLLDMRRELTDNDSSAALVLFTLGALQLRRATAIGRAGRAVGPPMRRALMYLREAQEHPGTPIALRGFMTSAGTMISALEQYVDPSSRTILAEIERVRGSLGGPAVFADQDIRTRLGMAVALSVEHERHHDPAALDSALRELEAARAAITERTGCGTAQEVYRHLAQVLRLRGAPGDTLRALEATERLLEKVAEDVLLQVGAEDGLAAARVAADWGVAAARWAAEAGDAATALRVLEAGRALVLRAVAASAGVPEQLAAHGHDELAAQWREAARSGESRRAAPGGPGQTADTLIPSTLRRRALSALRPRTASDGAPTGPDTADAPHEPSEPDWSLVADTARRVGVDAVVHLLVGDGDGPGWALVVRPGTAPLPLALPGLASAERGPLERYLDTARDRSLLTAPGVSVATAGRAEAVAAWETALEELCDWAGAAVMGPVLDVVRPGRSARPEDPVRLVLLPAGNLGSVPWHAARLGGPAGSVRERPVYAVDHAVISYAASGAEFLRAAARPRLPVSADPVLVADPRATLPYAEHEIDGLRTSFYPDARCYGYFVRNLWDVDGTPDELLPLLPGGTADRPAGLVQLSVHGFAGGRPTVSGLLLYAPRRRTEHDATDADDGTDGTGKRARDGDDPGVLTVRRLLGAYGRDDPGAAGPLVVLSACETDLSSRDHDEALTLTTAFVSRGAADVIGSKWGLDDASAAVLMYVVHHFLAEGADPAQALRSTQLWALDPATRPLLPGLPGPLAARVSHGSRLPVAAWAPFIHQGNPAPAQGHAPTRAGRPGGNTVEHR